MAAGWPGKPQLHRLLTDFPSRDSLPASRRLLCHGLERFGLEFPVLLQKNFHFSFRLFQFLPAGGREVNAFLEKGERFFQLDLTFLQFLNNLLQALETLFKFGQREFAPCLYFNATYSRGCPVFFVLSIKKLYELCSVT